MTSSFGDFHDKPKGNPTGVDVTTIKESYLDSITGQSRYRLSLIVLYLQAYLHLLHAMLSLRQSAQSLRQSKQ